MEAETILSNVEFAVFLLGYCWTMHPEIVDSCWHLYLNETRQEQPAPMEKPNPVTMNTTTKKTNLSMFGVTV